MKAVFTICSNNYLAQAKVLVDSFREYNPDVPFYLGLVDKRREDINYREFLPHTEVLEVGEDIVEGFEDMVRRYNIVELNTAVKPFLFEYLFRKGSFTQVLYFDPDIRIFHHLDSVWTYLEHSAAVLTPHFLSPVPNDGKTPFENAALNTGIYNLGFIGLNIKYKDTGRILKWWSERTFSFGYSNLGQGLFFDQLWINLLPVFFDDVRILKDPGLNMAPWNLHERVLEADPSKPGFLIVGQGPLIFYHYSSFDYKKPGVLAKHADRYSFEERPDLKILYRDYYLALLESNIDKYSKIECALNIVRYKPRIKDKIWAKIKPVLQKVWNKI